MTEQNRQKIEKAIGIGRLKRKYINGCYTLYFFFRYITILLGLPKCSHCMKLMDFPCYLVDPLKAFYLSLCIFIRYTRYMSEGHMTFI